MNRRLIASVAASLFVVAAGCTGAITGDQGAATGENRTATVVHVVDGDTVDVRFEDGSEERIRLLGVDTPEPYEDVSPDEFEGVPDTDAGRSCLRAWGERASEYAVERLDGETVTVEFDPESDRRGGYDRLLAYVVVGNESFNRALVANGYARLYDTEFTQRDAYAALERQARENGTGLWSCAD